MLRRILRRKIRFLLILVVTMAVTAPFFATILVRSVAKPRLFTVESVPHCRVALVLGSKIFRSGNLSWLLKDRVDTAIALYKAGKVDKLLMSGDNRVHSYNEPQCMRDYAVAHGVPAADVVMDFAGRRTYDSVYRAKHIFGQDRLIVVSQRFHVCRALYLCKRLGIEAYGVPGRLPGSPRDHRRELLASVSAVLDTCIWRPRPVMGRREHI